MKGYVLHIERRIGNTKILQYRFTDADSESEAFDNFHDYFSNFWGDGTEYNDGAYIRSDGGEQLRLLDISEIKDESGSENETLSTILQEIYGDNTDSERETMSTVLQELHEDNSEYETLKTLLREV